MSSKEIQTPQLPPQLLATLINPSTQLAAPLPRLAVEQHLIDRLGCGLNINLLMGVIKQCQNPTTVQKNVELHSANYKYLNKMFQQPMERSELKKMIMEVLGMCAYAIPDQDDPEMTASSSSGQL